MGDASYVQTSFLGGEVSQLAQGRIGQILIDPHETTRQGPLAAKRLLLARDEQDSQP